jgi:GT2 family glycosyltransferase
MITASIVIYNSPERDLQTIISCIAQSTVRTIYVIDNTPDDRIKEFVQKLSKKVVYMQGQGNVGYGAAHNIAIRESIRQGSNYHLVVNADIEFSEGTIEKLVNFMEDHPEAGQVIPKIVYPDGEIQYVCKLIPTPFDLLFRRFLFAQLNKKRADKFQLKFTGYNKIMNVPYHHGCFMFFSVSALIEIGLFDERFFMYPEDIDITRRMHEKYATLFYPYLEVTHTHTAESRKNLKMFFIHSMNMIRYFNKWCWFFDPKRSVVNKQVLKELGYKL